MTSFSSARKSALLQPIARVKRPLAGENTCYTVDYHGAVEHLDHALKIYGGEVELAQVYLESVLLQQPLDECLSASPTKSLLGKALSIVDGSDLALLTRLASPGAEGRVKKNQLRHVVARRDNNLTFFDKFTAKLEKLLEDEMAGRISQSRFQEQLELFGQRIKD